MKAITKFFVMVLVLFATSAVTFGRSYLTALSTRCYISQGPNNTNDQSAIAGLVLKGLLSNQPGKNMVVRASAQSVVDLMKKSGITLTGAFPGDQYIEIKGIYANNQTLVGSFIPYWWGGNIDPKTGKITIFPQSQDLLDTCNALGLFPQEIDQNIHESAGVFSTILSAPMYSFIVGSGARSAVTVSGWGLIELYDNGGPGHFEGLSTRAIVMDKDNGHIVMGFIISGDTPLKVLLRARGPGLVQYNLPAMMSPTMKLYDVHGNELAETTGGWDSSVAKNMVSNGSSGTKLAAALATIFTLAGATKADFDLTGDAALDSGSGDAAMVVTLPPGIYTMEVSSLNVSQDDGKYALAEVYDDSP